MLPDLWFDMLAQIWAEIKEKGFVPAQWIGARLLFIPKPAALGELRPITATTTLGVCLTGRVAGQEAMAGVRNARGDTGAQCGTGAQGAQADARGRQRHRRTHHLGRGPLEVLRQDPGSGWTTTWAG